MWEENVALLSNICRALRLHQCCLLPHKMSNVAPFASLCCLEIVTPHKFEKLIQKHSSSPSKQTLFNVIKESQVYGHIAVSPKKSHNTATVLQMCRTNKAVESLKNLIAIVVTTSKVVCLQNSVVTLITSTNCGCNGSGGKQFSFYFTVPCD